MIGIGTWCYVNHEGIFPGKDGGVDVKRSLIWFRGEELDNEVEEDEATSYKTYSFFGYQGHDDSDFVDEDESVE